MFCGQCGAEVREGDKFCGRCRAPVSLTPAAESPVGRDLPPQGQPAGPQTSHAGTSAPARPAGAPTPSAHRNRWKAAAVIAILVCMVVVGVLFLRSRSKAPTATLVGPVVELPPAIVFHAQQAAQSEQIGTVSQAQVAHPRREAALHPNDPKALNDAGVIAAAAGDTTQGLQLLQRAHQIAPNDPTITYNQARVLYQQCKPNDAITTAENAVQQQPQFDNAHLLLAAAAVQKQDYATAQQQLQQLQKQAQEIALLIQGVIRLKNHQVPQAIQSFQQAAQLASNDPNALYDLGLANQLNQNFPLAQRYYQSALNLNPNFTAARQNLGAVLAQPTSALGAKAQFQTAYQLGAPSPSPCNEAPAPSVGSPVPRIPIAEQQSGQVLGAPRARSAPASSSASGSPVYAAILGVWQGTWCGISYGTLRLSVTNGQLEGWLLTPGDGISQNNPNGSYSGPVTCAGLEPKWEGNATQTRLQNIGFDGRTLSFTVAQHAVNLVLTNSTLVWEHFSDGPPPVYRRTR